MNVAREDLERNYQSASPAESGAEAAEAPPPPTVVRSKKMTIVLFGLGIVGLVAFAMIARMMT